jgi:integral membrane protein (TIGR01906 family)
MKLKFPSFLSWLVSLITPLFLLGLGLRLLLTPLYYSIEYNMPYFPADEYGMTKEERLRWAPFAVEYLVNNADISYLAELQFDDGQMLYNPRELSHMEDVKRVTKGALNAWYVSILLLALLGAWAWYGEGKQAYRSGLRRGGWWMIALAGALAGIVGVGILINPDVFWEFFTLFHQVFFEGDSWLFYFSDTLIRLFPMRFWMDAFLWAAVIALGGGFALALGLRERNS